MNAINSISVGSEVLKDSSRICSHVDDHFMGLLGTTNKHFIQLEPDIWGDWLNLQCFEESISEVEVKEAIWRLSAN